MLRFRIVVAQASSCCGLVIVLLRGFSFNRRNTIDNKLALSTLIQAIRYFGCQYIFRRNKFKTVDQNGPSDKVDSFVIDKIDQKLNVLFIFPSLYDPECFIKNIVFIDKMRLDLQIGSSISDYHLSSLPVFEFDGDQGKAIFKLHGNVL